MQDLKVQDDRCATRDYLYGYSISKQALARVRLINHKFCKSASPLLFQVIDATWNDLSSDSRTKAVTQLWNISRNKIGHHVQKILVGFDRFFAFSHDLSEHLEDLVALLPAILIGLPSLREINFSGPESDRSNQEIPEPTRQLPHKAAQILIRYVQPPQLQELVLKLPLAYDFSLLSSISRSDLTSCRIPLGRFMSSLRHLHVQVSDNSGHGGVRYFTKPDTDAHRNHPNISYGGDFFRFVNLATNLESLKIMSTHHLNMELLELGYLKQLHVLEISNVNVSAGSFVALLIQNVRSLRALDLYGIELDGGTWETVFSQACKITHLDYLYVASCGYHIHGASSRYAPGLLPEPDNPQVLETYNFADYDALGKLQCHVMRVRKEKGLSQMTERDF